ncbi:hypothetical protein F5878DRAFT_660439 [Lentinula raphanica]|uniref:Uncharacterized protein n=1 Tax=Lentinula raphanica TaxID=153919 RepID=A0AA38PAE7_9AGAR|nr:hypothetical protein F5878DRAFT_660439 [Lentinula raphanica]
MRYYEFESHEAYRKKLRSDMFGGFLVASALLAAMVLVYFFMRMLLAPLFKAKELKRREESIVLREIELARQAQTLQFEVDILVCERLAQILERSALSIRDRVQELEIEKELFAEMTLQSEYGSTN